MGIVRHLLVRTKLSIVNTLSCSFLYCTYIQIYLHLPVPSKFITNK